MSGGKKIVERSWPNTNRISYVEYLPCSLTERERERKLKTT